MPTGRWIPENRSTRIPRTHICLDTESWQTVGDGETLHTFRCAVTSVDRMSHHNATWLAPAVKVHMDAHALWQWVTDQCKSKQRTVLVAHNLGFDLRVGEAFTHLPALGWSLEHLSLAPGSTWLTWKRQGATLSMVDSMTWLPTSLERIGVTIGRSKSRLPRNQTDTSLWLDRCRQDVEILRDAWLRIVAFLRDEDCGNWRPTGAGQSWSFWRHRMITHPVFAHDDVEVRAMERRAAWTGRAEPWRFGRQTDGPFTEWDFSNCYAQIAQRCEVPTMLKGEIQDATLAKVVRASRSCAVLVDADFTVPVPCVPTQSDGRIVWPVGSFASTVWENELHMALSHGADVRVKRAWVYRRAPALRQWADWVLERINAAPGEVDPIVRAICKHWARALIGRFGTRFSVWEPEGDAVPGQLGLMGTSDVDAESRGELLTVGGASWVASAMTDHPLSAPQVMSWIAAQARVDLWHAMSNAGFSDVIYVDTDSMIVNPSGDRALHAASIAGLRRKKRYVSLNVLGTRRLVEDHKLKASGVAKGAVRISRSTWSAESWDSLQSSLKSGDPGSVRVVTRRTTFRAADGRRRRMADGSSEPFRLEIVQVGSDDRNTANL